MTSLRPSDDPIDAEADRPAPIPSPAPAYRWGFGAFLLAEAVLLVSAVFLAAILDPSSRSVPASAANELVGTIVPTMLAAGVAVLATVLRGNGPVIDLRLAVRWSDVRTGVRFGLGGIVLTCLAVYVWTRIVGANDATSAIDSLLDGHRMSVLVAIVMFFYVWLVGPICEEIIFRGLLWGAIERQNWGRLAAFGLSTAIFAASHLEPIRTTLLLVIAVPIGLARLRTGRLPASVVAHQMNNFLPAVATLLVALGVMAR